MRTSGAMRAEPAEPWERDQWNMRTMRINGTMKAMRTSGPGSALMVPPVLMVLLALMNGSYGSAGSHGSYSSHAYDSYGSHGSTAMSIMWESVKLAKRWKLAEPLELLYYIHWSHSFKDLSIQHEQHAYIMYLYTDDRQSWCWSLMIVRLLYIIARILIVSLFYW